MLKDIPGILLLRKKKTTFVAMNRNAKEMLKGTEITHGKLILEVVDECLRKHCGASSKNYIIDVQE
jgi:hypothetical protein